ncbi:MAG: hypothetical protein KGL35_19120 [Bradyrhizobium sp.]|nr:hypothetical protein [Bradyrhizobium sp.]
MMRDYKFDYWQEALETALDEAGAQTALTIGQIVSVARSLQASAENQGMAFGHDAIPNPLKAEVTAAEKRLEASKQEAESREAELKQQITELRHRIRYLEYRLTEERAARA